MRVAFFASVIAAIMASSALAVELEGANLDQTRIHVKDKSLTEVNIEMPASLKKKITFDAPKLTVEDAGFRSASSAADLAQTDCDSDAEGCPCKKSCSTCRK